MKKYFLFLYMILIGKFCFSMTFDMASFYGLDFFQIAKLNHGIELLEAEPFRRFFLPCVDFESEGTISGDLTDGWSNCYVTPTFSVSEKLPSLVSLKCSLGADMIFSEGDNGINWLLSPAVSVSVPLVVSNEMVRSWNEAGKLYYGKNRRKADLDYWIALRSGTLEFVSCCGEYIYYRSLCRLMEKKIAFLERKSEDYEKLFRAGKITSLQLEEQFADRFEAVKSQRESESKLIEAQQKLGATGFSADRLGDDLCLREFTVFWSDYISSNFCESFMKDELDLVELEISRMSQAISTSNNLCYLSGGFSLNSSYEKNRFPDFSEAGWQFQFSLNFPVAFDFGNKSSLKKLSYKNRIISLEKEKVVRSQISSVKAREAELKNVECYVESMDESVELEEKRYEAYQELNKAGRVSNFDLQYQENNLQFTRLYKDYARFQLLLTKASFY